MNANILPDKIYHLNINVTIYRIESITEDFLEAFNERVC